jgi:hypothetical protein
MYLQHLVFVTPLLLPAAIVEELERSSNSSTHHLYLQHLVFVRPFVFTTTHCSLKAYCAILVRRSNFRHQTSPRASPRESTQRRKVELWAKNVRYFCLNVDFHVTFRDILHVVKLRHGTDGFTSPPKEGVLRIFLPLKIRRLQPGLNPRTRVPKASTLSLHHRSCVCHTVTATCHR